MPSDGCSWGQDDRSNEAVLRELTDDSGGRTEIIKHPTDLDSVTPSVADELSKQRYLAYMAKGHDDGHQRSIDVEVRAARGIAFAFFRDASRRLCRHVVLSSPVCQCLRSSSGSASSEVSAG